MAAWPDGEPVNYTPLGLMLLIGIVSLVVGLGGLYWLSQ
jgi:hypothetical protein